jgi:hypothetical protein
VIPFFNTATMLHREFNDKESLVSAVKQLYAQGGVATKIVRSAEDFTPTSR